MPVVNPGIRRLLASAIQRLFNGASFSAPLTHSAIPTRAASGTTATFTRATASTWPNNDGYMVTGVAGEIGFVGARRVRNLLTFTEDFTNAAWTANEVTFSAATAPDGTSTATLVKPSAVSTALHRVFQTPSATTGLLSVYAKAGGYNFLRLFSNSISAVFDLSDGTLFSGSGTITAVGDGWYRCSASGAASTSAIFLVYSERTGGAFSGDTTSGVYLWHPQLEDVTAQTTQTAGEYVSVGALDYRSELNRLYLSLPGTAGHYASTPDSVAASVTGDIAVVLDFAPNDLTNGNQSPIGKIQTTTTRSWFTQFDGTGTPSFTNSTDGTAGTQVVGLATATLGSVGIVDGQRFQLGFTLDVSDGSGNRVNKFFYSTNGGVTWTQLGATVTTAGTTSIFDSNSIVEVGGLLAGTTQMFAGKVYSAQIYNGIPPIFGGSGSATPVVDFNPHRDATTPTGTITSSTTGEVWTINGASSVVRSAAYHGSMVDGAKCFATDINGAAIPSSTLLGYQAEGARTNLCLQSNDPSNASWTKSAFITTTQNAVSPVGATNAWTITATAGATFAVFLQNITVAADTNSYTASCFVKKTTGTPATYPMFELQHSSATKTAGVVINTTSGTLTNRSVGGAIVAPDAKTITSWNDDYWRVTVTLANNSGTTSTIAFYPSINSDGTGVIVSGTLGSAVFYGAQVELGSFASSYIPTTTIAVARNADVLTYSSSGNINTAEGTACAELGTNWTTSSTTLVALAASSEQIFSSAAEVSTNARNSDGTTGLLKTGLTDMHTAPRKRGVSWSASASSRMLTGDGVAPTSGGFDGTMGSTAIYIGQASTGTAQWDGTIRNVRIWQRALSSSELQAITS